MPLVAHSSLRNGGAKRPPVSNTNKGGTAEMLARAALIGRVTRERVEARRASNLPPVQRRKKRKQVELIDAPKLSGFLSHCSRGSLMSLGAALLLIAIGAIMCNFAFHATTYATRTVTVGNHTEDIVNKSAYLGLRSMTYIGPSFMGVGAFLIIVFCVVLFDTREKAIKQAIQKQIKQQQDMSQEYAIKAVLSRCESNGGASKKPSIKGKKACDTSKQQKYHPDPKTGSKAATEEQRLLAGDPSGTNTSTPPVTIETVCEQLNSVSTISQPDTPKIQLKSSVYTNNSTTANNIADVFFQLSKMSSLSNESGPIITHHDSPAKTACHDGNHCNENMGFENSNYDLKSQLSAEPGNGTEEVIPEVKVSEGQYTAASNIITASNHVSLKLIDKNRASQAAIQSDDDDDTRPLCDLSTIQATYV